MISELEKDLLLPFTVFAKGEKPINYQNGGYCVIYTRVSSKEQTEGMSLETQLKACQQHAIKGKYEVMGVFGGTYESAKNDERKEFNRMLKFVRQSKQKITTIIVYSVDRFSRSGANAVYIAEQLRKEGIIIYSVMQPMDASTSSGTFFQNIQFIVSQYENQQRKEKCMAGVKESLLLGKWVMRPPVGYDILKRDGKKMLVINEKGRLLAKAFEWKAYGNLSLQSISDRLNAQGFKICFQKLSEAFRNPFYCGLIVHKALEGKIVRGQHPPLVSEEVFLAVNGILSRNKQGNRIGGNEENIPLKRFVRCHECDRYLRGYKASKNNKFYYKCNTIGCNCNKRAEELHEAFGRLFHQYSIILTDDMKTLIKKQITIIYESFNKGIEEQRSQLENRVEELTAKIKRMEKRFVMEEITQEMYLEYSAELKADKEKAEKELMKFGKQVSNLEKIIDKALDYSSKLAPLWDSSDYTNRLRLQFLVFPDGMTYNRRNNECRTPRINSVFYCISQLAGVLGKEKAGNNQLKFDVSRLVARTGVEPVIPP